MHFGSRREESDGHQNVSISSRLCPSSSMGFWSSPPPGNTKGSCLKQQRNLPPNTAKWIPNFVEVCFIQLYLIMSEWDERMTSPGKQNLLVNAGGLHMYADILSASSEPIVKPKSWPNSGDLILQFWPNVVCSIMVRQRDRLRTFLGGGEERDFVSSSGWVTSPRLFHLPFFSSNFF